MILENGKKKGFDWKHIRWLCSKKINITTNTSIYQLIHQLISQQVDVFFVVRKFDRDLKIRIMKDKKYRKTQTLKECA